MNDNNENELEQQPLQSAQQASPALPSSQPTAAQPVSQPPVNKVPLVQSPSSNSEALGVSQTIPEPTPVAKPQKKQRFSVKTVMIILGLLLLVAGLMTGAYFMGRGDKEVIFKTKEPKRLDLPPQAVVMTECIPGRGKQYILPQDIPQGPIYDVHDGKVVAIEYRIVIKDIESDPDKLSNTILGLTRDYPVDHFSMVPVITTSDKPVESFHLAMFVVSKEESKKITCPDAS